jgi:N-acetylneuraminate synthase
MLSSILKYDSRMVEFHIDLDGTGFEFKAGHCWLPDDIARVIKMVNESLIADGDGVIEPSESEIIEREWRADSSDGLRPLIKTRAKLLNGNKI